jgi:hypothetical protein
VDGLGIPASENPHTSGLAGCKRKGGAFAYRTDGWTRICLALRNQDGTESTGELTTLRAAKKTATFRNCASQQRQPDAIGRHDFNLWSTWLRIISDDIRHQRTIGMVLSSILAVYWSNGTQNRRDCETWTDVNYSRPAWAPVCWLARYLRALTMQPTMISLVLGSAL